MTGEDGTRDPRLPNLLVVGVSKAGTTSLFSYLAQHPDVCPADDKELRYFTPLRYGEPLEPLETYARRFRHRRGERYAVEATPGYFYGGLPLAQGVRTVLPGCKVVVSLRDPVERCWSWYRFVQSRARLAPDVGFAEYLDRCEQLREQGVDGAREHQVHWGLGGGCYAEWFPAWQRTFGSELKVVFFDDVCRTPLQVVTDLCVWLGIDDEVPRGFAYEVENRTEQYRQEWLQRAALFVNRRSTAFFLRHRGLKRGLRRSYYRLNRRADGGTMRPAERDRLRAFYRPSNEALRAALTAAGYPRLPDWLPPQRSAPDPVPAPSPAP